MTGAWPHMTEKPPLVTKSLEQRLEALENAVWALIEDPHQPVSSAEKAKLKMLHSGSGAGSVQVSTY